MGQLLEPGQVRRGLFGQSAGQTQVDTPHHHGGQREEDDGVEQG